MTDNHEEALRYADGEFICLIGDDDSVLPEIIDAVELARDKQIDVLVPSMSATYSWPDFQTRFYGTAHAGRLYLSRFSERLEEISSQEALKNGLRDTFQGTDGLPKLYHGLVRRQLVEDIRARYGRFFYGTSPDVSAAVALSLATKRFHTWERPFTLPGASGGSNSGRSALNKHKGDFKTDPHMSAFKNLSWDEVIPKFFSVETVWANAAWETLFRMGKSNELSRFNLNRLYALCILKHRDYREAVEHAFKAASARRELSVSRASVTKEIAIALAQRVGSKVRRLTHPSPSNGRLALGPYDDVCQAQCGLVEFLNNPRE